jgi:glutamate synthase domain-containing protein 3
LHFTKTASKRAQYLLKHWENESSKFVRMTPKTQL